MQILSNNLFGLFLAFCVIPYFFYKSQEKLLWVFIAWLLTIGITDFSANLLKSYFLDFRPCFSDYSYLLDDKGQLLNQCSATLTGMPSNHSANFFAGSLFLLTIFKGILKLNPTSDTFTQQRVTREDGGYSTTGANLTRRSSSVIPNMRSQNISFTGTRLKPSTKFFTFFSRVDMSERRKLTTPKLLEVTPLSGSFIAGETVSGLVLNNIVTPCNTFSQGNKRVVTSINTHQRRKRIRFRLATPNHKDGPYLNPSTQKSEACIEAVGAAKGTGRIVGTSVGAAAAPALSGVPFIGWVAAGWVAMFGGNQGADIGANMAEGLNKNC